MNRSIQRITLLLCFIVIRGGFGRSIAHAQGTAFVVNRGADGSDFNQGDGKCDITPFLLGEQCTLRAALEETVALGAADGPYSISFDIQRSERIVIQPKTPFPWINVPINIDGTTQPGSSCATEEDPANLQIFLDGSEVDSGGSTVNGLFLINGSEMSTIKGLVIGNFDGHGMRILSDFNTIECNHIGVDPESDQSADIGNRLTGILLSGSDTVIGGIGSVSTRNVIGNNAGGISISFGKRNSVLNNYIGLEQDGRGKAGNGYGIVVTGDHNQIGDGSEMGRNIIVNSDGSIGYGISIVYGNYNSILGNYIGLSPATATAMGNDGPGISVRGDSQFNIIGMPSTPNVITNNWRDGIQFDGATIEFEEEFPENNLVRGNSIFDNRDLGIDINNDGVTTENIPKIVVEDSRLLIVIDGEAQTQYVIDIFRNDYCDFSGYGEGQEFLTQVEVTTNIEGSGFDIFDLPDGLKLGDSLTATASDLDTSEFSECVTISSLPVTPTPTPTISITETVTPTVNGTPSPTIVATETPTGTVSATPEGTPSATPTFEETAQPPAESDHFIYVPLVQK